MRLRLATVGHDDAVENLKRDVSLSLEEQNVTCAEKGGLRGATVPTGRLSYSTPFTDGGMMNCPAMVLVGPTDCTIFSSLSIFFYTNYPQQIEILRTNWDSWAGGRAGVHAS